MKPFRRKEKTLLAVMNVPSNNRQNETKRHSQNRKGTDASGFATTRMCVQCGEVFARRETHAGYHSVAAGAPTRNLPKRYMFDLTHTAFSHPGASFWHLTEKKCRVPQNVTNDSQGGAYKFWQQPCGRVVFCPSLGRHFQHSVATAAATSFVSLYAAKIQNQHQK